ncbi:MAG: major capsid family protein [Bradymonadaceae bacterium]
MARRWNFDDLDPQVGMYFEEELTSVRSEVKKKKKKPKNGFKLIPQDPDDPDWSETVEHRMWDIEGTGSEFISDYTDMPPLVGVNMEKDDWPVKEFGCAYQYSKNEIRKASSTGKGLDRKKAMAAREFNERKFNRIQWFGAPQVGLFGLLNYPYIPRWQVSIPFDNSQTGQDILNELNSFVRAPFDVTEDEADTPDTLLMPTTQFAYINDTPWSSNAGDTTILGHFRSNNFFIDDVRPVRECNGAGPNGEDVMLAYRQEEDLVAHKLVMEHNQHDPQQEGLAFITPATAKSGGIVSDFPFEMVIGEFPL